LSILRCTTLRVILEWLLFILHIWWIVKWLFFLSLKCNLCIVLFSLKFNDWSCCRDTSMFEKKIPISYVVKLLRVQTSVTRFPLWFERR
jgi:hypothetical protein